MDEGLIQVQRSLEAIQRLAHALKNLQSGKNDLSHDDNSWRHWRVLPSEMSQLYDWLHSGAEVVQAVSTKFTLISSLDISQAGYLAVRSVRAKSISITNPIVSIIYIYI